MHINSSRNSVKIFFVEKNDFFSVPVFKVPHFCNSKLACNNMLGCKIYDIHFLLLKWRMHFAWIAVSTSCFWSVWMASKSHTNKLKITCISDWFSLAWTSPQPPNGGPGRPLVVGLCRVWNFLLGMIFQV